MQRQGVDPRKTAIYTPNAIEQITHVAILGTFTPRRCGIATFTADLARAIEGQSPAVQVDAFAMSDQPYDYDARVIEEIAVDNPIAYGLAAQSMNRRSYDVLSVQHEYGIFGGMAGKHLLHLVRAANMPVVTTLHTILREPTPDQREVLDELITLSHRMVVMSRSAIDILAKVHDVDMSKVDFIPHGIPKIPSRAGAALRREVGGAGPLLLTFGLLSPDKGIENVIHALPSLVATFPELRYWVVGATHPHVAATSGESYRHRLVALAEELGVAQNVEFVDEYVSLDRLIEYLSATDFYITPYLNPMQITSGTLAYSLGAGKVVISTPYEYAKEVLAEGRGILVPFADPGAIAEAVASSWRSDATRDRMGYEATQYGANMHWDRVGALYLKSFRRALRESIRFTSLTASLAALDLPEVSSAHLEALTDDTGLAQHARFSVPYRAEGYCVDDNARALLWTTQLEFNGPLHPRLRRLQSCYLAFVADAYDPSSRKFRNFMSYRREWLESAGSEDSQGRSMWALGAAAGRCRTPGHATVAAKLFDHAVPQLLETTSPRTWAYGILGAARYLEAAPGTVSAEFLLERLSAKLDGLFETHATAAWPWIEPRLAYANARVAEALITAGAMLENPAMMDRGLDALRWLLDHQTSRQGWFSPVGTDGAGPDDFGALQFDQQPIEAWSSVSACLAARKATGRGEFLDRAVRCFQWFLGGNVLGVHVANPDHGSCFDGILQDGVNLNQGAESTLAYLCALTELRSAFAGTYEPAVVASELF